MPFFHFSQNNSGGRFHGPYHHIVVEAPSARVANALAEDSGLIYFDGCDTGSDCSCCGDRWSRAWDGDEDDEPKIYSTPIAEYSTEYGWSEVPKNLVIYMDGRRVEFDDGKPSKAA